jgi:hypothetical protein
MDVRGIRESTLKHNLEYFQDFIVDGMQRREKVLILNIAVGRRTEDEGRGIGRH